MMQTESRGSRENRHIRGIQYSLQAATTNLPTSAASINMGRMRDILVKDFWLASLYSSI